MRHGQCKTGFILRSWVGGSTGRDCLGTSEAHRGRIAQVAEPHDGLLANSPPSQRRVEREACPDLGWQRRVLVCLHFDTNKNTFEARPEEGPSQDQNVVSKLILQHPLGLSLSLSLARPVPLPAPRSQIRAR